MSGAQRMTDRCSMDNRLRLMDSLTDNGITPALLDSSTKCLRLVTEWARGKVRGAVEAYHQRTRGAGQSSSPERAKAVMVVPRGFGLCAPLSDGEIE